MTSERFKELEEQIADFKRRIAELDEKGS